MCRGVSFATLIPWSCCLHFVSLCISSANTVSKSSIDLEVNTLPSVPMPLTNAPPLGVAIATERSGVFAVSDVTRDCYAQAHGNRNSTATPISYVHPDPDHLQE